MKKLRLKLISLFFLISISMYAQLDKYSLMGLPSGATSQINAVTPIDNSPGAIVYNDETKTIMVFDGSNWVNIATASSTVTVKALTESYILTAEDNGIVITIENSGTTTLTIPTGLDVGFNVSLYQIGSGLVTITGDTGVTVLNRLSRFKTAGKDAGIGIVCTAANIYHITGDLKK